MLEREKDLPSEEDVVKVDPSENLMQENAWSASANQSKRFSNETRDLLNADDSERNLSNDNEVPNVETITVSHNMVPRVNKSPSKHKQLDLFHSVLKRKDVAIFSSRAKNKKPLFVKRNLLNRKYSLIANDSSILPEKSERREHHNRIATSPSWLDKKNIPNKLNKVVVYETNTLNNSNRSPLFESTRSDVSPGENFPTNADALSCKHATCSVSPRKRMRVEDSKCDYKRKNSEIQSVSCEINKPPETLNNLLPGKSSSCSHHCRYVDTCPKNITDNNVEPDSSFSESRCCFPGDRLNSIGHHSNCSVSNCSPSFGHKTCSFFESSHRKPCRQSHSSSSGSNYPDSLICKNNSATETNIGCCNSKLELCQPVARCDSPQTLPRCSGFCDGTPSTHDNFAGSCCGSSQSLPHSSRPSDSSCGSHRNNTRAVSRRSSSSVSRRCSCNVCPCVNAHGCPKPTFLGERFPDYLQPSNGEREDLTEERSRCRHSRDSCVSSRESCVSSRESCANSRESCANLTAAVALTQMATSCCKRFVSKVNCDIFGKFFFHDFNVNLTASETCSIKVLPGKESRFLNICIANKGKVETTGFSCCTSIILYNFT